MLLDEPGNARTGGDTVIPCNACESQSGWVRGIRNGRSYSYVCANCAGKGLVKPSQSILPGMEQAVEDHRRSAAELSAEELSAEFQKPLGTVDKHAAEMELKSPLFYGTYHPTLF
jgi:hypothetical protein